MANDSTISSMFATLFFAAALAAPHFDALPDNTLIDEPVVIALRGLPPATRVTIALRRAPWSSEATFVADANGVVDLTRTAPVRGDYSGVDPMGLFWSAHRDAPAPQPERGIDAFHPPTEVWRLTATVDGETVASASLTRRAVADNVAMSAVRERGLAGVLYTPPTLGKHPAVIVLGGSGGGLLPASHIPGGLASRGYVVLSLAYFGIAGLPPRLHDIPLEYFGTALEWLAAQPSVDPNRIAVAGISRGGELSLLLGSIFPQIRAVIAYVPSNVIVAGCCERRGESSWTLGGRALAWTMPGMRDERATIRVERIRGAVLLISGRDDRVWPSTEMANAVMARLDASHFAWPHEHLAYDDAGHGIARPYTSTAEVSHVRHPLTGRILSLGGTPAGTARAREDSWRKVLAFLEKNLR
jgi:dienelactone hydrolase